MKKITITLCLLAAGFLNANAIQLTTFGTSDFTALGWTNSNTFTQYLNSVDLAGDDGGDFGGDFTSVFDLTGFTNFSLTGTQSAGTATSVISVILYNDDLTTATYTGGSWTDIASFGTTTVSFFSQESGFDISAVNGMDISLGGGGFETFTANFTSFDTAVVPEPSAYAAIAGVLVLGFTAVRRRRRA